MGLWRLFATGLTLLASNALGCSGKVITASENETDGKAGASQSVRPTGDSQTSGPQNAGGGPSASSVGGGNASGPSHAGASSGGAGSAVAGASAAGAPSPGSGSGGLLEGVPLTPFDGWIDGFSNVLAVQGAVFSAADPTSVETMRSDFSGAHACISGTAARVDLTSLPCTTLMYTPPATDCYGEFWGAMIGMNLNQAIIASSLTAGEPMPFDASALKGFSFELSGSIVPAPRDLRFQVVSASRMFCNLPTVKLHPGTNTVLFTDLVERCFAVTAPMNASAVAVQSALETLAWQVLTNTTSTLPYDFCVSNIRALPK